MNYTKNLSSHTAASKTVTSIPALFKPIALSIIRQDVGYVLVLRCLSHQESPHIPPPTIATLKSFEEAMPGDNVLSEKQEQNPT